MNLHQYPWAWISVYVECYYRARNFPKRYKNENVNIVRSLEADKFEQVEYLRSSVVRKLSKV